MYNINPPLSCSVPSRSTLGGPHMLQCTSTDARRKNPITANNRAHAFDPLLRDTILTFYTEMSLGNTVQYIDNVAKFLEKCKTIKDCICDIFLKINIKFMACILRGDTAGKSHFCLHFQFIELICF